MKGLPESTLSKLLLWNVAGRPILNLRCHNTKSFTANRSNISALLCSMSLEGVSGRNRWSFYTRGVTEYTVLLLPRHPERTTINRICAMLTLICTLSPISVLGCPPSGVLNSDWDTEPAGHGFESMTG